MRHSGLCLAAIFLFSTFTTAQHSSGGTSGGSSSSGGGASHGSSASSSSSGGGHSTGGSSSSASGHSSGGSHSSGGNSASHVSNARGSNSALHSETRSSHSNVERPVHEPNRGVSPRTGQPQKRSFLSMLRHPFRKPESKQVADLRRPVCFRGPCPVCPMGGVRSGGRCGSPVPSGNQDLSCSRPDLWSGGGCLANTDFRGNCDGYRMSLEQQARRMQAADSLRQSACTNPGAAACSESMAAWQSEQNLYRALQNRYQRCQAHNIGSLPFGYNVTAFGAGWWHDPLRTELNY
jgi:hypothetical protein